MVTLAYRAGGILCIFGSALTVYDGYARVIAEAIALLAPTKLSTTAVFTPVLITMAICSFSIVLFFKSALLAMLGFAMTLAFLTTPIFAWLNHGLVKRFALHPDVKANKLVQILSYAGLLYLFGFLLLFVGWKWFG